MEVVNWILANWATLLQGVLMVLGGASIIAKLTPTDADDKVINSILKVIHGFGLTKKND